LREVLLATEGDTSNSAAAATAREETRAIVEGMTFVLDDDAMMPSEICDNRF
jgi:hypothetical protein